MMNSMKNIIRIVKREIKCFLGFTAFYVLLGHVFFNVAASHEFCSLVRGIVLFLVSIVTFMLIMAIRFYFFIDNKEEEGLVEDDSLVNDDNLVID